MGFGGGQVVVHVVVEGGHAVVVMGAHVVVFVGGQIVGKV